MILSPAEIRRRQRKKRLISMFSIVMMLILWYLATEQFELIPPLKFPSPPAILETLGQVQSTILEHSVVTLIRVISSFILGSLIGMIVGMVMSRFQIVFAILDPIIEAIRPIPPIALVPFFILWFGIGDFGQILLAGMGCFMVMVISTVEAVRNVPRIYTQAAQSLGANTAHIYRTVIIPAIIPELIAGWRVALALAFGLTIAAELMGAQSGLGFMIMVARRSLNTQTIFLGILIIGLEATAVDRLLNTITRRLTVWTERSH
ncbi:MAG: ABC transporter permease [Chloroflexi bacterium]|nr:ABC transporter permease [Chloroflexota bacterium]